jgi:lysophospholipase L1-like esterase
MPATKGKAAGERFLMKRKNSGSDPAMHKCGNAAILLASCVLAFVIMEIAVRVLDIPPRPLDPLPVPSYRLSTNPAIGYEYRPDYRPTDTPFDRSHKGYAINHAGFRDYEYPEAKPEGTYRIIVLGDSTTAGNGIGDFTKTYPKLLEAALNRGPHAGRRYEVLNMGVGGYHTLQEIETLRTKGLKYQPDLVLVALCINDFNLTSDGGVYEQLLGANQLSPRNADYRILHRNALRFSRLAFIIYHRLVSSDTTYSQWYSANVLKGQSTVRAGLVLLSELQRKHGFSAIVAILPGFRRSFDKYRSGDIHQKVFQAADGLPGITVIDLLENFSRINNNARKFSFDYLHLNQYGHRVMAEILIRIVLKAAGDKFPTNMRIEPIPTAGPDATADPDMTSR